MHIGRTPWMKDIVVYDLLNNIIYYPTEWTLNITVLNNSPCPLKFFA